MNSAIAINRSRGHSFLPLAVVLILAAFTHLLNPIGFPTQHGDEAHYMRRAMHVLDGLGPQERVSSDRPYDHPYFGQIFLAAILGSIGYPDSLHPRADVHSIEMLYLGPRVLMGLLAIVDTFLVYKIAERRYNKNIALLAALLFAVMPSTWFVRRILLDSILLPFLLLSILFATTSNKKINNTHDTAKELAYSAKDRHNEKKTLNRMNIPVILISGIFLGLAVFTKIPSICISPLIGYMIVSNVRKWRSLGMWLIPVIFIPLIWPSYSLLTDKFPNWMNDVIWQGGREGSGIWSLYSVIKMDPILTSLGIAGLVFAIVKRDFLPILWMIPFMIFIEFIGFTQNFYWIIVLPAFCIAGAALIYSMLGKIGKAIISKGSPQKALEEYGTGNLLPRQKYGVFNRVYTFFREYASGLSSYTILYAVTLVGLGIFGLVSTTMIIEPFLNSTHFELYAFIVQSLPEYQDASGPNNNANNKVTVIGDRRWLAEFLWVPEYVFGKDLQFRGNFRTSAISLNEPIETNKVLLIVDSRLMGDISSNSDEKHIRQLQAIYNSTRAIGTFEDSEEYKIVRSQRNTYPFTSMEDNRGTGDIEIRVNY